jgi:hypothetical protein
MRRRRLLLPRAFAETRARGSGDRELEIIQFLPLHLLNDSAFYVCGVILRRFVVCIGRYGMNYSTAVSSLVAAILLGHQLRAEILTYRFTGDEPEFRFSCGECSGFPHVTRARLKGTFQVSLDRELGIGTLLAVEARLVGNEGLFGEGHWLPYGDEKDFLPAGTFYDSYRPPFTGVYAPAHFRPLGPNTATLAHFQQFAGIPKSKAPTIVQRWLMQKVGFEPAPTNAWSLSFDGNLPLPDGYTVAILSSFDIYFEEDSALLTYSLPIIDASPEISAARAVLVPEPSGLWLVIVGLILASEFRQRVPSGRALR